MLNYKENRNETKINNHQTFINNLIDYLFPEMQLAINILKSQINYSVKNTPNNLIVLLVK